MRLFLLTCLTMIAFAANSLFNRLALVDGSIGPAEFAGIRVASGAVVLTALILARSGNTLSFARPDLVGISSLSAYMLGFSFAYVSMDAGLGALILFAGVQVTMFAGALALGERPPLQRWAGMTIALAGLAVLTWPREAVAAPLGSAALMSLAAIGWGVYSMVGRRVADPLASTAWNFVYALPVVLVVLPIAIEGPVVLSGSGVVLAILSGGVTSALGYSLWYALLPRLGVSVAALAQLSVPAIAIVMGALFLGETVTPLTLGATALILGGIALGLLPKRAPDPR